MFTIAVLNQKGGVGKTTTVANLGAAIAARGCDVCLVDLDPQSHLTLHFGVEPGSPPASVYDVLVDNAELPAATLELAPGLHLVPSVIDLAAAEVELAATVGREQILRDALAAHSLPHRLILIDCPPSLGLLTLNALAAADELIIPLQPHFLALQGLGKLLQTVSLVQRRINPALRVSGVILCMYETGTRLATEVVADLEGFFDAARDTDCPWGRTRIFQNIIRRNIKLAECPSHGKTIFEYDAASRGAEDYAALADEFAGYYPFLFDRPAVPEPPAEVAVAPAPEADRQPPASALEPAPAPPQPEAPAPPQDHPAPEPPAAEPLPQGDVPAPPPPAGEAEQEPT